MDHEVVCGVSEFHDHLAKVWVGLGRNKHLALQFKLLRSGIDRCGKHGDVYILTQFSKWDLPRIEVCIAFDTVRKARRARGCLGPCARYVRPSWNRSSD